MPNTPPRLAKKKFFTSPNVLLERIISAPRALLGHDSNHGKVDDKDTSKDGGGVVKGGARHLRNIFAVPMSIVRHAVTDSDDGSSKTKTGRPGEVPALPSYKHDEGEIKFIIDSLKDHYLFEALPDKEFNRIAQAFELIEVDGTTTNDTVVIKQGDRVNTSNAYFYLLYQGRCVYEVNDEVVGDQALPGDCFGELALLYNCPRAATVKALTTNGTVKLFRIHQTGFRQILQQESEQPDDHKYKLLDNLPFVSQMLTSDMKDALVKAMQAKVYEKGEYVSKNEDYAAVWTIIEKGTIRATNFHQFSSTSTYQDIVIEHGECFGELFIYRNAPMPFDLVADTDCVCFTIDKETFINVIGGIEALQKIARASGDIKKLRGVPILSDTIQGDNTRVLTYLASCIKDKKYPKGHSINIEGFRIDSPALYLVRGGSNGKIHITNKHGRNEFIGVDYFFGEDQLLSDTKGEQKISVSDYTATVVDDDLTLGVLKLESCRKVMNTRKMGKQQTFNFDSLKISPGKPLTLNDLHRHRILGAGTFGQVWLVSREGTDGVKHAYALKVQSKYELIENGQARGVVYEKQIMSQMSHPFVGGLVSSFQDTNYVYMLMPLIQGGELYGVMHTIRMTSDMRVLEKKATFYIACITEGLSYMHRRGYVYRYVKTYSVCDHQFLSYYLVLTQSIIIGSDFVSLFP
jgi:CRP-like cAMP-binding protein